VYDQREQRFLFHPGPVFSQLLLADEINRASPRTQSALLEAMQERQVTTEGMTRPLKAPFMVIATQNPIELEGTYPLPEAQLDRFLMSVALGYPTADEERQVLRRFREQDPLSTLQAVAKADQVAEIVYICRQVYVHPLIEGYIVTLANATRSSDDLALGISPRGSMALYRSAQTLAAVSGRDFVIPDDIQTLLRPVWRHRIIPTTRRHLTGADSEQILSAIVAAVPVPVEERWSVAEEA